MTTLARRADDAPIACTKLGQTGKLVRLRADGEHDLFAKPFGELAAGDTVLATATWADGEYESAAAAVTAIKGAVVELECVAEVGVGTRAWTIRRSRV